MLLDGSLPKFLMVAALTIVISPIAAALLGMFGSMIVPTNEPTVMGSRGPIATASATLLRTVLFGWMIWGPVLLIAIFPGYLLWTAAFGRLVAKGFGANKSLAAATLLVIAFAVTVASAAMRLISQENFSIGFRYLLTAGWTALLVAPFFTWVLFRNQLEVQQ